MSFEGADADGCHYVKLNGSTYDEHQQERQPDSHTPNNNDKAPAKPWLLWPIFVISLLMGATAGPIMKLMDRVGPISMAGWRHQVSALVMLPGFIYEGNRMGKMGRQKALSLRNVSLHMLSSLALAGHFAAYIWAIYQTSIPHCLFLVNTSPVFVAVYVKATGGVLLQWEVYGVILGLLGIGIFAFENSIGSDGGASHLGDAASVIAAIFMAVYLMVGKTLRTSMPLFVYQFPVAVCVMIVLGVAGLVFEGWNESEVGLISGPVGWLRAEYLKEVVFLGVGGGFLGHAGYSYVLKYSSPLVMPTGLSLTAFIGSFISWLMGQSPTPGVWTFMGGLVTLSGTLFVSIASNLPETKTEPNDGFHESLPQ